MGYILRGVVLSYPQLFTPKLPPNARPGQKARYSAQFLIPKDLNIRELEEICLNMLVEKWGEKVQEMLSYPPPNNLKWPFRRDNIKQDGSKRFDEEKYKCFISAWSESPPGLVERYAGPDGKPKKVLQPSQDLFYPGAVVNVSVNPFVYDQTGNRGVNFGLQNLQMWDKGERLDNRVAAEDQFTAEAPPAVDLSQVAQPGAGAGDQPVTSVQGTAAAAGGRGAALSNLFS